MTENETLLLNAKKAAALIGLHASTWSELKSRDELPPSVRVGNRDYWNRDTLKEWAKQLETKGQNHEQGTHHTS